MPNRQPRDGWQRLLEVACGLLPFAFLTFLIVASIYWPAAAAVVLAAYAIAWLVKLLGYAQRLAGSYYYYRLAQAIDWQDKLAGLTGKAAAPAGTDSFWQRRAEAWYRGLLARSAGPSDRIDPRELYQAIIIATYNEPADVLEATIQAVLQSAYDPARIMLLVAYEARGSAESKRAAKRLMGLYGKGLQLAKAVEHPADLPGEAQAKAGNITYAAKWLSNYCREQDISPAHVVVTTLDADNKPHPQYLANLAWTYAVTPERIRRAYQPLPLFTNNIWDVPAPVRIIAADTSFWYMMESLRPRRLRLFSAYAQSLQTLEDVNYWNVKTIVEDGHQYWRTYFAYSGDFQVMPIWLPVYQDAVLAGGYWRTLQAQFRQLQRWAWGVSDTPFVIRQSLKASYISWPNKLTHVYRQLDDYLSWATAPIVLAIGGWLSFLLQTRTGRPLIQEQLPYLLAGVQLAAFIPLIIAVSVYIAVLPPRPRRYGRLRTGAMVLQWVLEPLTLILFLSTASLAASARQVLGKPLEKFHVTTKKRVDESVPA